MRRFVVAALLLAVAADAAGAQEKRRFFRSRAAFARLDTMVLMDSAEMRPMDPTQRFDSLMIQILDHLNATYAPAAGFPPARMRSWEGFSTQVHPAAGILVDRPEVDGLMQKLRERKEAAGLDSSEIRRRVNHVAQFVVGHEYAHLLQYAWLPRELVEDPNATRIIECAADIVGGALHRQYAINSFKAGQALEGALAATRDFGWLIGSGNWLDATSHPIPEHRMQCIRTGQSTADTNVHRLTNWSVAEARRVTGAGSVISRDKSGVVDRDSSAVPFIRELVTLAEGGGEALLDLKGPGLPGDSVFILRKSLPEPWRCTLLVQTDETTARCEANTTSGEYHTLVAAIGDVLRARASWAPDDAGAAGRPGRRSGHALRTNGRVRARVAVVMSEGQSFAQQAAPASRIVVNVSALR